MLPSSSSILSSVNFLSTEYAKVTFLISLYLPNIFAYTSTSDPGFGITGLVLTSNSGEYLSPGTESSSMSITLDSIP
jgi:hypothetical protein